MAKYQFETTWNVEGRLEEAWELIINCEIWPEWWKGVVKVEKIASPENNVFYSEWEGIIPYTFGFFVCIKKVEPYQKIELEAWGDLKGSGSWSFLQNGDMISILYKWSVETTKPWMNAISSAGRPLFSLNHDQLMKWGGEGLTQRLNPTAKLKTTHSLLPASTLKGQFEKNVKKFRLLTTLNSLLFKSK